MDSEMMRRIKAAGLRTTWQNVKARALKEASEIDPNWAKEITNTFDRGLGPKLDDYYRELNKGPIKTTWRKIEEKLDAVRRVVDEYTNRLNALKNITTEHRMALTGFLKVFIQATEEDKRWFQRHWG